MEKTILAETRVRTNNVVNLWRGQQSIDDTCGRHTTDAVCVKTNFSDTSKLAIFFRAVRRDQ